MNWCGVEDNDVKDGIDGIDGSSLLLWLQEWSHCDFVNFGASSSSSSNDLGCRKAVWLALGQGRGLLRSITA